LGYKHLIILQLIVRNPIKDINCYRRWQAAFEQSSLEQPDGQATVDGLHNKTVVI